MKARLVSAIVLAGAVSLGVSGCGFVTPAATTYEYAPSDGVSANVGEVLVRNALIVVDDSNSNFNLAMTTVNDGKKASELEISIVIKGARDSKTVTAEPGATQFGNAKQGQEQIVFTDLKAKAGQTVVAYFSADGGPEVKQYVPVLGGELKEYKPLVVK